MGRRLSEAMRGRVAWGGEEMEWYSSDASSYRVVPAAAALPEDAEDVAAAVRFAAENGVAVTARGGGTGLVGGALGGGIVLDLRLLDSVRVGDGFVEAGAGAPKGLVDARLAEAGMFLGPNPSVGPYCTVGGMVATNAAGSRSLKYGATIDNLLGVELVDGLGRLVGLPGDRAAAERIAAIAAGADGSAYPRTAKNSCGYRLDAAGSAGEAHRALAGSEGTLGIIVSARLRAAPLPARRCLAVLEYGSMEEAAADCPRIARAGPSALEMADGGLAGRGGCLLMVELERGREAGEALARLLRGRLVESTDDAAGMRAWWRSRDASLSRSMAALGGRGAPGGPLPDVMEDAAVPPARLGELVSLAGEVCRRFRLRCVAYGHAGSGNLHLRLAPLPGGDCRPREAAEAYFEGVRRLGGTVTAEHGDGLARTRFVRDQYGAGVHGLFVRLKRLMDPCGIMNPGKVVAAGAAGAPRAGGQKLAKL